MPKLEKSTNHDHKPTSSEGGQDTLACNMAGHSLHASPGNGRKPQI